MASGEKPSVLALVLLAMAALSGSADARAEARIPPGPAFDVLDPWQAAEAGTSRPALAAMSARGESAARGALNFLLIEVVDPWPDPSARQAERSASWLPVSDSDIINPWRLEPGAVLSLGRSEVVDPWRFGKALEVLPSSGL